MITINDACINLIISFEGFSATPYHGDADRPDVFTIGYGTTRYPPDYLRGRMVALSDPSITRQKAFDFMRWEVALKSQAIDMALRDDLTSNQFGALVSFTYNLGEGALRSSTLRKKVNANPNDLSIRREFAKWTHSNGRVVKGLIRRREAEANLYFTR